MNFYRPKDAAREAAIERINALLAQGPASRATISATLGLNENTCSIYLGYMRKERMIRTNGKRRSFAALEWELGEDPNLPPEGYADQRSVKACQVGIKRDWLVAALFGPAREVTA